MGCFSSKVVTRSSSFQEELNQNLHRRNKGFPCVLEELLSSRNGGDQFLAIVCSANNKKLQCGSFTSESEGPAHPETVNTWELMAGLEEEQQSPLREEGSIDLHRRSRSFHLSPEQKDSGGMARSRSFHTVGEYDALVEKAQLQDSVTDTILASNKYNCGTWATSEMERKDKSYLRDGEENSSKEQSGTHDNSEAAEATDELMKRAPVSARANEKGSKRKAMAKELTSLRIPSSTIELPAVVSLRDSMAVTGQVYSPGAYVTPKFGSFGLPVSLNNDKYRDGSVFDPDILSAFEEAMQQLEVEEERILKQIEENLEEEISPHTVE